MEYLIKVSTVIAIFYICYKLFLQRDTFFKHNRWFLLMGLLSAFCIPFYVITEYIEYTPMPLHSYSFDEVLVQPKDTPFNVFDYLPFIYFIGVIFFGVKFLIEMASLSALIYKNKRDKKGTYVFVETDANISPFSFFNWIVFNPKKFSEIELEQILTHEKVHVEQYHSIDVLITQIACILLWFNPFIWFYNKDLKQNLEFLADYDAINFSNNKKAYQYTLLKTSMPTHQLALSNPFYNSLIKKRIVMLQKSKSRKINLIKYSFVLPLLAIFLMSFNTEKVYVEKETATNKFTDLENPIENTETVLDQNDDLQNAVETTETEHVDKTASRSSENAKKTHLVNDEVSAVITKETSDASLEKMAAKLKEEGVTVKFNDVKRNINGDITAIKITAKSKKSNANFNINSDEAIKPIKINFDKENDAISIGNISSKHKVSSYAFTSRDDSHKYENHGDSIYISRKVHKIRKMSDDDSKDVDFIIETEGDSENDKLVIIKNKGKGNAIFLSGDVIVETESDIIKENEDGYSVKTVIRNNNIISLNNDNKEKPLYIIDGKEHKKDTLDDINPKDIQSVSVLKGEKAIEKYGDKGKNGVVEIITNK